MEYNIQNSNIQKILQYILLADSYTMPLQWNYDLEQIHTLVENNSIDLNILNSGKYSNYFSNKKAGEQTHYGDMLLHLYQYCKQNNTFVIDDYAKAWLQFIHSYDGYKDGTTKHCYNNLQKNNVPYDITSTDFCGVICGLPLISVAKTQHCGIEETIALIQQRSAMTHNHELIQEGIQWLIHAGVAIAHDTNVETMIEYANKKSKNNEFIQLIEKGIHLAKSDKDTRSLIEDAGLGCDIRSNLPYCIILLLREKFDFLSLMKANTVAGSDSAPRAMFLAYLLASGSNEEVAASLLSQLKAPIKD